MNTRQVYRRVHRLIRRYGSTLAHVSAIETGARPRYNAYLRVWRCLPPSRRHLAVIAYRAILDVTRYDPLSWPIDKAWGTIRVTDVRGTGAVASWRREE